MTQCERVLEYMKTNDGITSMDAYRLGCTRLAARIADLKKEGHSIWAERVTINNKTFVRYHLNGKQKDVLAENN